MGWVADLLKEVPTAAKYKADLETMERENASLKASNAALRAELDRLRASGQTSSPVLSNLSSAAETVLSFIAKHEDSSPSQIAHSTDISKNVVEMHLDDLLQLKHVNAHYMMGREPEYYLEQVGRRYLHTRGLLE